MIRPTFSIEESVIPPAPSGIHSLGSMAPHIRSLASASALHSLVNLHQAAYQHL